MDRAPKPRKSARQSRSRATVAAILEAAARILETDGPAGLTTNRVAERAGVSVGSLYQYFPDKTAILAELVRDYRAGMMADLSKAAAHLGDAPMQVVLDRMVRAALLHHVPRPGLAAALEAVERSLPLAAETLALKAQIHAAVLGLLAARGVPRPDITARDLIAITHGMAEAATLAGPVDVDDLHQRILRAVAGYVRG